MELTVFLCISAQVCLLLQVARMMFLLRLKKKINEKHVKASLPPKPQTILVELY